MSPTTSTDTLAIDGGPKVREKPFPTVSDASGRNLGEEEIRLLTEVIQSGKLNRTVTTESKVKAFEQGFAEWLGVDEAVASTSGTSALHLAVAALNPNPGDEIIVTPITDFGSVIPILAQTAVPVFADVDPETWCVDPESIRANITDRTKAIMVVHLFGQPADLDPIMEIANEHNIPVIEDCSQAYGATYKGRKAGTTGTIGCFSLQQSKHITAGDGGITVTNDPDLAMRMRLFSDKGWPREGNLRTHLFLGLNYRMTELQGAVALAQLGKLDGVIADRQRAGHLLTELLAGVPGISIPSLPENSASVFWLYPINFDSDVLGASVQDIAKAISAEGVGVNPGYVMPLYLTPAMTEANTFGDSHFPFDSAYTTRSYKDYREGLCPNSESMKQRMATLAINERYTEDDVRDIATAIRKVATAFAAKAQG